MKTSKNLKSQIEKRMIKLAWNARRIMRSTVAGTWDHTYHQGYHSAMRQAISMLRRDRPW